LRPASIDFFLVFKNFRGLADVMRDYLNRALYKDLVKRSLSNMK